MQNYIEEDELIKIIGDHGQWFLTLILSFKISLI